MKKNSNLKSAILYAQALYSGSEDGHKLDDSYKCAQKLKDILCENIQDFKLLDNPLWDIQKKFEIIDILGNKLKLNSIFINTLKLLAQKQKINLLPDVIHQFILLYQDANDIATVEVSTVIPLTKTQDILLKEKLAAIFNKKIIINYIINTQIIGGLVIQYGSHFIDASIKNKLNALEKFMKGTK